ncbi:MAG: hypothetical protein JW751_14165 [Polyangiaceae bacterium]|nr:hypothetical protein [Polyangiaceae bacterium]
MVLVRHPLTALAPLPWLVALAFAVGPDAPSTAGLSPDLALAVAEALKSEGLTVVPEEVHLIDPAPGLLGALVARPRAVIRAHRQGEPADIFIVHTELSPEGRLRRVVARHNLTDTSAVDERGLVVGEHRIAWVIGDDRTFSVELADLRGPFATEMDELHEFSPVQRWQQELTNLQEMGQRTGIARRTFKLDPAASKVSLALTPTEFWIVADDRRIRVSMADAASIVEGAGFVQEQEHHLARPGNLVTWAVDRIRALPWFGSNRMQALKAIAFAALDRVDSFRGSVTGDDGSAEVKDELGDLLEVKVADTTDPETGWPPRPLELVMSKPLDGEGKWRLLDSDPFVRTNPGAPAPFATTFIRVDRKRQYDQIWVTVWDPRQVELHTMSGTVEPKSATGATGPGLVPRKPEVMGRLLAGLNGGFQAEHGEYGMMADGVMYLPPKPFAATVALLDDGSNAFGTWPREDTIPAHVVSYRQNMTPLVMDGKVNPYQRNWWGGVPEGWTEESRTTRSGICMTEERFIAYFYGASTDDKNLAQAMQRTRCAYGIHLDMNAGHTGLEFYRAGPASEVQPLGRPLQRKWEAEGEVLDMPGWRYRGRRMLRNMGLMNFPRYVNRESRDFFYLTLRHLLPGEPVASALAASEADEGQWRVAGLHQHGWPYAIATAWVHADSARPETKVRLLKVDPRMVKVAEGADARDALVLAVPERPPSTESTTSLYMVSRRFLIAQERPADATLIATGWRPADPVDQPPVGAVGIDAGGMLVYAEVATGSGNTADRVMLSGLLGRLGCRDIVLLGRVLGAAIGGTRDIGDHPVAVPRKSVLLIRAEAPGARRIFTETPVVHPDIWFKLQAKRVRYFKKNRAGGPSPATPLTEAGEGAEASPVAAPAAKEPDG